MRSKADVGGQSLSALYIARKKNLNPDAMTDRQLTLHSSASPNAHDRLSGIRTSAVGVIGVLKSIIGRKEEVDGHQVLPGSEDMQGQINIENALLIIANPEAPKNRRNLLTMIIHQWSFLFEEGESLIERYCTLYELLCQCLSIRQQYKDAKGAIMENYDLVSQIIEYDCLLLMYVGFLKRNHGVHSTSNVIDTDAWYCFLRDWSKALTSIDEDMNLRYFGDSINIHNILLTSINEKDVGNEAYATHEEIKNLVTNILMHERKQRVRECEEQEKFVHNLLFHLELTLDIISPDSTLASDMISRNQGNPLDIRLVLDRVQLVRAGVKSFNTYIITSDDSTKNNLKNLIEALDMIDKTIQGGYIFSYEMQESMCSLYSCALSINGNVVYSPSKAAILRKAKDEETLEYYHGMYGAYSIYFMYLKTQHKIQIRENVDDTNKGDCTLVKSDQTLLDVVFKPKRSREPTILVIDPNFAAEMKNTQLEDLCSAYKVDPRTFYTRRNIILGKNGFSYHAERKLNASEEYHVSLSKFSKETHNIEENIQYVWDTLSETTQKKARNCAFEKSDSNVDDNSKRKEVFDLFGEIQKKESKYVRACNFVMKDDNIDDFFNVFANVENHTKQALNTIAYYFCRKVFNDTTLWNMAPAYFCASTSVRIEPTADRKQLDYMFRRMRTEPLLVDAAVAEDMMQRIPFLQHQKVDLLKEPTDTKYFLLWIQLACRINSPGDVKICDVVGAWKDGIDTEYPESIVNKAFTGAPSGSIAEGFKQEYRCKKQYDADDISNTSNYEQPLLKQNSGSVGEASATQEPTSVNDDEDEEQDLKDKAMIQNLDNSFVRFESHCKVPDGTAQDQFEQEMFSVADFHKIMKMNEQCSQLYELLKKCDNKATGARFDILTKYSNRPSAIFGNKNIKNLGDFKGIEKSEEFQTASVFYELLLKALKKSIEDKYTIEKMKGREKMKGQLLNKCVRLIDMIYSGTNFMHPDSVPLNDGVQIETFSSLFPRILHDFLKFDEKIKSIQASLENHEHEKSDDAPAIVQFYIHLLQANKNIANKSIDYLRRWADKIKKGNSHDSEDTAEDNYYLNAETEAITFIKNMSTFIEKFDEEKIPFTNPADEHYLGGASQAAFGDNNLEQASTGSVKPGPQAWAPCPASAAGPDTACANAFQHPFQHPYLSLTMSAAGSYTGALPMGAAGSYTGALPMGAAGPYTGALPMGAAMFPTALQHWPYGQGGTGNVFQVHPAQCSMPPGGPQMCHVLYLP